MIKRKFYPVQGAKYKGLDYTPNIDFSLDDVGSDTARELMINEIINLWDEEEDIKGSNYLVLKILRNIKVKGILILDKVGD